MTYLFEYYAYFLIANKQIKVRMNQKPKQESKIDAEFRRIYVLEFGFVREFSVNFTNYRNYTKNEFMGQR